MAQNRHDFHSSVTVSQAEGITPQPIIPARMSQSGAGGRLGSGTLREWIDYVSS